MPKTLKTEDKHFNSYCKIFVWFIF